MSTMPSNPAGFQELHHLLATPRGRPFPPCLEHPLYDTLPGTYLSSTTYHHSDDTASDSMPTLHASKVVSLANANRMEHPPQLAVTLDSHQRPDRPDLKPTLHPASHPQAQAQPQSTEGVQSRWMALKTLAATWPRGTIEPPDSTGESPLMEFVNRSECKYHCLVPVEGGLCDREHIRKDRILPHIRNEHLHFRPFACGGRCDLDDWSVFPTQYYTLMQTDSLAFSQMSFSSKSAWREHVCPRMAICAWWVSPSLLSLLLSSLMTSFAPFSGKETSTQNLRLHQMRACPQRFV
jgi:hypothetical protein